MLYWYLSVVSDCNDASSRKNCDFCVLVDKWRISLYTLEQAIRKLKPDRLYIVANFTDVQGMLSRNIWF